MRAGVWLGICVLVCSVCGCATDGGLRFPGTGRRSPARPDSAAIRARLLDARVGRLEESAGRQEALLRRTNADLTAQIESLTEEVRRLSERIAASENRWSPRGRSDASGFQTGQGTEEYAVAFLDSAGTPPGSLTPADTLRATGAGGLEGAESAAAPALAEGRFPAPPAEGERLYQIAYQDLMQDNYQLALLNFRAFLERYPHTNLTDNAQYWIAEVYYEQRQFDVAVEEFRKVVDNYPREEKVSAAYYKLGLCFQNLRDLPTARRYFDRLIELYPDSQEAQLARERRAEP